ncbi:MAG: phage tail protein [Bacteroidales bacterium]
MKKIIYTLLFCIITITAWAQAPLSFNYQAVLRNDLGEPMISEEVTLVVSILKGSAEGSVVFSETHNTTTNEMGLVNIRIGTVESLETVNWNDDNYFIQVNVNGVLMGTTQLLSVPYALHANTADETDPVFGNSTAAGIDDENITNWDTTHAWGDHTDAGYLTEEVDPVFENSTAAGINAEDTGNWDTAHAWGNHADTGYLTVETDPLFEASPANSITQSHIENWNANKVPAGVINQFAGSVAPEGYLICDGTELNRTEYAELFAVIGTTYGEGDGSTTFNLPNLQSRIPVGMSAEPEFDELGKTGGAKTHTLSIEELPSHTHAGSSSEAGEHNHSAGTAPAGGHTHSGSTNSSGNHSHFATTNTSGAHSHSGTTAPGGYSGSVNISQGIGSNIPVAGSAGSHSHNFETNTTGSHSHSVSIGAAGSHTHSLYIGGVSHHAHAISDDGIHLHEISIEETGNGNPHNNLQPYIVLNFIIKY